MTNPAQNNADYDPLASSIKRPAVSFKETAVGTVRKFTVESLSREAQTTVFGTTDLAYWPANSDGTRNPKMAVVFDVIEEGSDEPRSLWCPRPSSLLTAVATAQQEAGKRISPGGTLEIRLTGTKPSGKGNDQKLYAARYSPPAPGFTPDPLTSGPTGAAPAAADPWAATPSTPDNAPPF